MLYIYIHLCPSPTSCYLPINVKPELPPDLRGPGLRGEGALHAFAAGKFQHQPHRVAAFAVGHHRRGAEELLGRGQQALVLGVAPGPDEMDQLVVAIMVRAT